MKRTRFSWVLGTDGAQAAERILRLSFWSPAQDDTARATTVIDLAAVRDLRRASTR